MDYAHDKFLKKFPMNSVIYKRGNELIIKGKEKITSIIQEKLTKWLVEINKEQIALVFCKAITYFFIGIHYIR